MEAEVPNVVTSDSMSAPMDAGIEPLIIDPPLLSARETIEKVDSSSSSDTIVFTGSDEPKTESGRALLVTTQGEVGDDAVEQSETGNDSSEKLKIVDDSEIKTAAHRVSTTEDNASTIDSDIEIIDLGNGKIAPENLNNSITDSKDTANSTRASMTDSSLDNVAGVQSPSSKENLVPEEKGCEKSEDEISKRAESEVEAPSSTSPEIIDGDVSPEIIDDVLPESPVIDELIIPADEPLDERVSIEYEMGKSAENGYASENCSTPNVSVDLLENGQLVAKTEIEFENEDEMDSPSVGSRELSESIKMETDDSNVDYEPDSALENGLPVVKRDISNDNETTIDDINDNSEENTIKDEQVDTDSPQPVKERIKLKIKRTRYTTDSEADEVRYLLPFNYGWKRELVLRSGHHFKRGDVYYYTPEGRKLRAMTKVSEYLKANNNQNLTLANFTYAVCSFNSPHAYTRQAVSKFSKKTGTDTANSDSHPSTSQPPKKKWKTKPKTGPSNTAMCPITTKSVKKNGNVAKMQPPSAKPPTSEPYFILKPATNNNSMEVPRAPVFPPPHPLPSPAQNTTEKIVTFSNDTCSDNCDTEMKLIKRCTHMCPGQEGVIPSLHCNKCLCLFHPRCVGISDSFAGSSNFTCQECGGGEVMLRKQVERTLVNLTIPTGAAQWTVNNFPTAPPPPPPIFYDTSTRLPYRNDYGSCGLPLPQRLPFDVNSGFLQRTCTPMPPSDCNFGTVKRFPCGVTIEKVPPGFSASGPSELPSASISVIPMTPMPPVCVPALNSTNDSIRMIVPDQCPPPTGESQRSILRPVVIPTSNSAFPLLKNAIMKYTKSVRPPMARRIFTHQGQFNRITNNGLPTQQKLSPMGLSLLKKSCNSKPGPSSQSMPTTNDSHDRSVQPSTPIITNMNPASETPPPANQTNAMYSLNCGILSLITIFKYLGAGDLLRASQVCRAWKLLVRHPTVWEMVRLRDVRINDWEAFVKIVKTFGTRHLDTTGMLVVGTRSSAFQGFVNAMNKLTDLDGLTLGETPPEVVYATVTRLPQLKRFSAEWIVDFNRDNTGPCSFTDIGNIAAMPHLEILRLRGFHGLCLPKLNSGLQRLGSLRQLTCLAITSLKDVPSSEFGFLYQLVNLTTLELGNCTYWTEGVYAAVSLMKNLKKLRLEFGGNGAERGIQIILSTLTNLVRLELIVFGIPPNFGDLLSRIKNLRQLTVWPDLKHNPAINNFYTVKATTQITFVRTMTWGLVISHLTDPDRAAPGQVNHNSCCVPFLNSDPTFTPPNPVIRTYISAHELMNKLRAKMPHSKVQVIMVPNESFSTICYMPR